MKITVVNEEEKIKYLQPYFWPLFEDKSKVLGGDGYFSYEEQVNKKSTLHVFFNNDNHQSLEYLLTALLEQDRNKKYFYIFLYPSNTDNDYVVHELKNYYGSVALYADHDFQKKDSESTDNSFTIKSNPLADQEVKDVCTLWNDLFHTPFYQEIKYYAEFNETKILLNEAQNHLFYSKNTLVGHIAIKKNQKQFYTERNVTTELFMYIVDHRILGKNERIKIHKYLNNLLTNEDAPYMVGAITKNKLAIDFYKKIGFTPKFYSYTLRD